jgi:hypothetical protein
VTCARHERREHSVAGGDKKAHIVLAQMHAVCTPRCCRVRPPLFLAFRRSTCVLLCVPGHAGMAKRCCVSLGSLDWRCACELQCVYLCLARGAKCVASPWWWWWWW